MTSSLDIVTGAKCGRFLDLQGPSCKSPHVTCREIYGTHRKLNQEMTMRFGNYCLFERKCSTLQSSWRTSRSILDSLPKSRAIGYFHTHQSLLNSRKLACMTVSCGYNPGSSQSDAMGGDSKVQKMLVEMLQIQVGKARMSDFVDERSQYLRNIAQEAHEEYDRIAYRTMKEFEATGSRVLRELDADASAIERELQIVRAEIEAQSKDFEEFQLRSAYSRNEGLFFKNLYQAPRVLGYKSTYPSSALKKVREFTVVAPSPSKDFSTSYTQVLYGGLSLVIVSFIWSSSSVILEVPPVQDTSEFGGHF
ncbi:hypothetical protein O6H91_06G072100 [Diphasiastrum complanatum]|uniref:Uncharacterized protein n=1 Tax=Diphasiastrum complanatum TaxID=34168 RepID=A0ACC2DF94_DIPCM|nr:hypothetical protein O6H91_06G072100 [Diphasiastrum complanatum]